MQSKTICNGEIEVREPKNELFFDILEVIAFLEIDDEEAEICLEHIYCNGLDYKSIKCASGRIFINFKAVIYLLKHSENVRNREELFWWTINKCEYRSFKRQ